MAGSWVRTGCFCLWVLLQASLPLLSQAAAEAASQGRPFMKVFTDRDGLPQNAVEAVQLDSDGYLWVGTQGGAAFYNGRRWTPVRLPNPEVSQWIRCILRTRDGSLWFGRDQGGINRYRSGGWTSYGPSAGLPAVKVHALLERWDGSVVAGTSGGLFVLKGGAWSPLTDAGGKALPPVLSLLEARGPGYPLWVGTEAGLACVREGSWSWQGTREGLPSAEVWSLHESFGTGGTTLWAGTALGLARLDHGRWKTVGAKEGVPANVVNRILETRGADGEPVIWVATDEGLGRLEKGRWRFLNTRSGLPNQVVHSLLAAPGRGRHSTVWAGTFGGLVRLQQRAWSALDMRSGLPDDVVFCLRETQQPQALWAGTLGGGLARFEHGRWSVYGPDSAVPDRHILALLDTHREPAGPALWVGSRGGGVLRMQGERWQRLGEGQGLPDSWVYALHESAPGSGPWRLWAGTRKGPAWWDGHRWRIPDAALPPAPVMAFLGSKGGRGQDQLWVATRGEGVFLLEGGRWRVYQKEDGLSDNRAMALLEVKDPDGARWLWVGAYQGLSRKRLDQEDAPWEAMSGERLPGLPGQLVYQLQADAKGRIYAFTDHGVARLTPRVASPEDPAAFSVYTFTTGDGLPSNGCTQGSSMVDRGGRIWTGTVGGIGVMDPAAEPETRALGPLRMERMRIGGRDLPLVQGREIPWKERSLLFEYALLSYVREEDIRYSTQLEGLEGAPSEWGTDGKREYPTLPAGRYVFKVWARDHVGNLAGPASCSLRILPPPWQTWWAGLGLALGLAGFVTLVVRSRTALLRARTRELERGVQERTEALSRAVEELKAARDQAMQATWAKSDFLATMSHEIRTPLNAIVGMAGILSGSELNSEQRDCTETLRHSADSLLGILNDVLDFSKMEASRMDLERVPFDLLEEVEDCLGLLAESAQRKGLELSATIHPGIPLRLVGDPARLRQILVNLVGNAIKFTPKGEVLLEVTELGPTGAGSWLRFEVRDQGVGIPAEALPRLFTAYSQAGSSTQRRFGGTGLGLAICKRLADLMEGRMGAESVQGQGSTFWLELPFQLQIDPWPQPAAFSGDPLVLVATAAKGCSEGLRLCLESWGFRVRILSSREELVASLPEESERATALLLDAALLSESWPRSGEPRDLGCPPALPVVIMAHVNQLNRAGRERPAGLAGTLAKPVRRMRLHQALRRVLKLEELPDPSLESSEMGGRGRVLVVDDNEANRKVALLHLRTLGIEAEVAVDAEEALRLVEGGAFDLVLMDCEMPEVDGFEATRRLRTQEAAGVRIPVVALTAHRSEVVRQRCLEAGMDECLSKPLRPEEFAGVLGRFLAPASAASEFRSAAPASPGPGPLVLDPRTWEGLQHLESLTGPGAIADLVEAFQADAPIRLDRLERAFAQGDADGAARDAHDLKANAATLGALRLAGVMAEIEAAARGEGHLDRAAALARARSLLAEVQAALTLRLT